MKILRSLLNAILVVSLSSALAASAQSASSQTGRIHGHVTSYTGEAQSSGMICLSADGGVTLAYTFPVDAHGNYAGEARPGSYSLIFRMPDTPPSLWIDSINGIVITAGQDLEQNDDMSRQEFINDLPDEQKKQLEELKKQNAAAQSQDKIFKAINADLTVASQDLKDADNARGTAGRELGRTTAASDLDARAEAIKSAKCTEAESLMLKDLASLKDSGLTADETALWESLARAQIGLKKYEDAEKSFKHILEIQSASTSPKSDVEARANAGLGEIYARTGKALEAGKAYDLAVQLDPAHAGLYLRNEAFVFMQAGDADAQIAAAEKAIKTEPRDPLAYYIKGNGLLKKSGVDLNAKNLVLPPGSAEAYQKYLTLAPNGPYAPEVRAVLHRTEKRTSAAN